MISADWLPRLLAWADSHCTKGAAATRAAVSRPEEYTRCLARLDELWWQWAARIWAGWPPERRRQHDARFEDLVRGGVTPRDAERQAFLERTEGRAAA